MEKIIKSTKYKIEVMQAFVDGKTIEQRSRVTEDSLWKITKNPEWDWYNNMYCIKSEEDYVPYTFDDDLLGKKVYAVSDKYKALILDQDSKGVTLGNCQSVTYEELLENFVYERIGETIPCGRRTQND